MSAWEGVEVDPSCTHHTRDGVPLYGARFLEVLAFHAPGLAPVRDTSGMYHIDVSAKPAYTERFLRTFGFYEGLAGVETSADVSVAYHIRPDGVSVYQRRWTWVGNFQGGRCTVRSADGLYRHIDASGEAVYAETWRYAGDFRDGIAVVHGPGGATHIDRHGALIHGRWFLDLDVFHKGYARARDPGGWMHIDRGAVPAYARRFAAVEPFYNGQARVERLDGGVEVIDEAGRTVLRLGAR